MENINVADLYRKKTAEVASAKIGVRNKEDMFDGLLQVINHIAEDRLSIRTVSAHRSRENTSGLSPQRPFLSYEVAYQLGDVDGTPFYCYNSKLYAPENKSNAAVPFIKEVDVSNVSGDIIQGLLKNITAIVASNKEPEVHSQSFFIFRYTMPSRSDKNRRETVYVPVTAQKYEAAVTGFLNRGEYALDIARAEDIRVHYASRWMHVEKLPLSSDMARSRTTGGPIANLAVQE